MSDTTSEPFHVFPEHPNQTLHTFVFALVILGSIGSVVWHVRKDQAARNILSTGGFRLRAVKFTLLYVVTPFLILSPIIIPMSGDPKSVLGLVLSAVAYEGILNWYLLFRYGNNNAGDGNVSTVQGRRDEDSKLARLGRRLAYVSSLVLCGASVASSQFDDIDYYGPVRITGAKLYADRPEQSISKVTPSYYYYYTLQETLEWGNDWGCPSRYGDSKWCEYSHLLDKDEYGSTCKKRIDCPGNPPDGKLGECATASQQLSAQLYLIKCVSDITENGQTPDFSNGRYFDHGTPPWSDFPNGAVAAISTRTVAASCDKCEAFPSVPPDDLAKQARVAWSVGLLLAATTVLMLFYDRFRAGKTPIYFPSQTHDLELS